jgi:hypothetical protein
MCNKYRRSFLIGAAACLLTSTSLAQDAENSPLIIREHIPGVDPRYARYATQGPFVFSASPTTVKGRGFDYMVFFPRNCF